MRIESKQVLVRTQPASSSRTLVDSSRRTAEGCHMATNDDKKNFDVPTKQARIMSNAEYMETVEMEYEKTRADPKEAAIRGEIKD